MPWVEPKEGVDKDFIDFVKNYRQQIRPDVIKFLGQYSDKEVFIFKDRDEADKFLAQLWQQICEKIEAAIGFKK